MMEHPNVFTGEVSQDLVGRIDKLQPGTVPGWGKMNAGQMLAHLNVAYDSSLTDKYPRPGAVIRFFIKKFAAPIVIGSKPYPKNGRTAPEFIIKGDRDFGAEKAKLIQHITSTAALGEAHFEGKENKSFGVLTSNQWNNLFYKHLDHHLKQFGV